MISRAIFHSITIIATALTILQVWTKVNMLVISMDRVVPGGSVVNHNSRHYRANFPNNMYVIPRNVIIRHTRSVLARGAQCIGINPRSVR